MNSKRFLFLLLCFSIICCGIVPGQLQIGCTIETDRPFYYIGDVLNGTVTGPPNLNYSINLCNTTSWIYYHLTTQNLGPVGRDQFDVSLVEDWIEPGRYSLNMTIDGHSVAVKIITIEYDAEYLHEKEHEWFQQFADWVERTLSNVGESVNYLTDRVEKFIRLNFVLFTLILIIGGQVFLHVIIPRFYSHMQQKQRGHRLKRRQSGIAAKIPEWHEKQQRKIPDHLKPDLIPLSDQLVNIGLPPETAKTCVWDATGEPGHGDITKDLVSKLRMKRHIRRTLKKLRNERGLAGEYFVIQAEKQLKDFESGLKKLKKEHEKMMLEKKHET